jgi:hypothetical protein
VWSATPLDYRASVSPDHSRCFGNRRQAAPLFFISMALLSAAAAKQTSGAFIVCHKSIDLLIRRTMDGFEIFD